MLKQNHESLSRAKLCWCSMTTTQQTDQDSQNYKLESFSNWKHNSFFKFKCNLSHTYVLFIQFHANRSFWISLFGWTDGWAFVNYASPHFPFHISLSQQLMEINTYGCSASPPGRHSAKLVYNTWLYGMFFEGSSVIHAICVLTLVNGINSSACFCTALNHNQWRLETLCTIRRKPGEASRPSKVRATVARKTDEQVGVKRK